MADAIPIKVIPLWVKVVVILVLLLVFAGSFTWVGHRLSTLADENKALRDNQEALLKRIKVEEGKNARQDAIFAERDAKQNEVRQGVADVTVRIKQEKANDPATRVVLDTRLPAGLRRALRQAPAAGSTAERKGADRTH